MCLISVFSDYEKYTLMEYTANDDSKLVFFNPKNTELCMKLLKLREGMENPYTSMNDWLQEEEIDIEAMIEAITSLNGLEETKDKLAQKISSISSDLIDLRAGKKTIKSFFSFKSKQEDFADLEQEKAYSEKCLADIEVIIKLASFNLDSYIDYFKVEKLAGYYRSLQYFSEITKTNAVKVNELWQTVSNDKNIAKLMEMDK